ncbi:MAG: SUMF1/EgtB/PvdO family nonheme iron enzyme [Planctomycetaceae bacterium]|nr:SUMF1/EgtB/PvdO family nonheme iron enzyme [Planctomycetaceae bacterium]
MSAGMGIYRDELDVSYAVDFGRDREPTQKRSRHPEYRRKGSAPARVNGLHCRRNKRWTWGSGRGARMQNMRAFAGCLAFAVASLAVNAFGVPINYNVVGNPGNTGNASSNPSGLGAVSSVFKMATTETTNAQYVAFLNSVDPNGTNPNSIYSSSMGSSINGGISFNAGAGAGSKYSVKAGAPTGAPAGTSYGSMPVNFVTWFSAARFVNWLNNGATGTSSTESGAYTLANAVSGPIVARNPGAQVFLPSANEWYKAAFFNGSSYTTYATNSNSVPTAQVTNFSLANSGNFSDVTTLPVNAESYVNSASAYGMYDMFGNVGEMTDSAGAGNNFVSVGGGYAAIPSAWAATAAQNFRLSTAANVSNGFRVAAVPEPGTIALAGVGIGGLAGLDWMKRRKKRLAARQAG